MRCARRHYIGGYPRQAVGQAFSRPLLGGFIALLAYLGLPGNVHQLRVHGTKWTAVLAIAFCLPIFLLGAAMFFSELVNGVRELSSGRLLASLQAYRRGEHCAIPDPRDSRNRYGRALARHCRQLDALALRLSVTPLYDFGLANKNAGLSVWYAAAEGLRTVDALLHYLENTPQDMPADSDLLHELTLLRSALARCDEFCLMLV